MTRQRGLCVALARTYVWPALSLLERHGGMSCEVWHTDTANHRYLAPWRIRDYVNYYPSIEVRLPAGQTLVASPGQDAVLALGGRSMTLPLYRQYANHFVWLLPDGGFVRINFNAWNYPKRWYWYNDEGNGHG